jgi:poly-gamma-glutamate synthesis protein (capsule biosynthesis protein)
MLGREVAARLAEQPAEAVWSDEVKHLCVACDAVVCNLECCVSGRGSPTTRIPRKPFFFRAPPSATDALRAIGVSAVSLANNHALDFEAAALLDTLDHLATASIAAAGAGRNVERARLGTIRPAGGLRLGLLAATDHPEAYGAGEVSPGVAFADLSAGLPDWMAAELGRLRSEADVVVAFPHWGPNMTTGPAHWQRARARELVAAGADLVAGHSAHVFHGIEWIGEHPVVYDLGGALDDYAVDPRLRNDLGLVALWRPEGEPRLELVGLELRYCETALASGAEADWIAARLESACAPFGTRVERIGEQRFAALPP